MKQKEPQKAQQVCLKAYELYQNNHVSSSLQKLTDFMKKANYLLPEEVLLANDYALVA